MPARWQSGSQLLNLGERVAAGQLIGRLHDFSDHSIPASRFAPRVTGCIVMMHLSARPHEGPDTLRCRRGTELGRGRRVKITDVQLFVLKSEGLYNNPEGSEEPLGPTYMGVVKVSTDEGISGYSDLESCASVAKACVDAPKWSQEPGMECFDGLASLARRRESARSGAALVPDVPRQHLLWPPRRCDSGDLGNRHRACGTSAGKSTGSRSTSCWAANGVTRCAPTEARYFVRRPRPCGKRCSSTLTKASRRSSSGGEFSARIRKQDVKLVEAARDALGDDRDLLVDTGWFVERTPKEAIQVVRSIEQFRPFLVEELLHPEDYDGYRQVAEHVETRIACGEQEATEWGFAQLIERGGVDVLQPDLTRCGGFTVARKIVHMAERANRLVIPHSWSSDLLTAASLHLGSISAARRVCRVQHVARTAEPHAGERAAANERWISSRSDRDRV